VIHRNKLNYVKLNCTESCVVSIIQSVSVNNFTISTNAGTLYGINKRTFDKYLRSTTESYNFSMTSVGIICYEIV